MNKKHPKLSLSGSLLILCLECFFDELGQLNVSLGKALYIVSGECDVNLVVHVEPFGMMVHFLSFECNSGHKSECRVEVSEAEALLNGFSVLDHCPSDIHQRCQ